QVHVDDNKGEISFAPVAEIGSGDSSSGDGVGGGEAGEQKEQEEEEEEEEEETARYGCDPRNAWSPWSYAVVTVEGRTVLDVVPPTITFSETLVTTRSDLDPFLHVEALTYEPGSGGTGGGGGAAGGGGAEGASGEGISPETSVGGGGGGQFLTFGLSSWNSAVVGSAFLVVGLLLLVQPVLALKAWWREGGGGSSDERGPAGGGGGGANGGRTGRGGKLRGQWRYGQLENDWDNGSEFSDGGVYEGEDDNDDGWGSEGEWQGETSSGVGMPPSPSEGDHFQASATPRLGRRFMQDSLRRRGADGAALGTGGGGGGEGTRGDAGGIQLGPMGKSGRGEANLI
ncbi:unnamed protein product, partial [Ectocarpus sp. 12 AP-2014]